MSKPFQKWLTMLLDDKKSITDEKNMRPRICLCGATHPTNDERMRYREAEVLSRRYSVEVVGVAGKQSRTTAAGIEITSFKRKSKIFHFSLVFRFILHLRSNRYDVVHCFDLDSLIAAVVAFRFSKSRPLLIYDAHEHFPSLMSRYLNLPNRIASVIESAIGAVELRFADSCAGFITVNDYLTRRFSRFGRPSVIVRNIPPLSWYDSSEDRTVLTTIREPIVIYIGNLSNDKGLQEMIQAKALLDKDGVKTCFVIVGNVKGTSETELGRRGFLLTGWIPFPSLPAYLRRASVGLALIQPVMQNYVIAQPNKVFAYMIAGLPIVATDLPGMKFIATEGCGILISPGDPASAASAIAKVINDAGLRTNLGGNGRKAAESEYNGESEDRKLLEFYDSLQIGS